MFSESFRKILRLYGQHRGHTAKFFALTTLHSAAFLYVPYLFRAANNVTKGPEADTDRYSLMRFALRHLAGEEATLKRKYAVVFGTCATYLVLLGLVSRWRIVNNRVLEDLLAQDLRRQIVANLRHKNRLPTSQLTQKAINDVNVITHSSTAALFSMLRGTVFFAGGMTAMLSGFPQLAGLSLPFVAILTLNGYYYNEQLRRASARQIDSQGSIAGELGQLNEHQRTVRTQKCEALLMPFFEQKLAENHVNARRLAAIRGRNFFFTEVFGVGYLISLVAYASYLISSGQLQSENILLSLYAVYAALGIRAINSGYSDLKEKIGVLNSLERFLGEPLGQSAPARPPSPAFLFFERFEQFFAAEAALDRPASEEVRRMREVVEQFLREQRRSVDVEVSGLWLRHGLERAAGREAATGQPVAFIEHLRVQTGEQTGVQGRSGMGKSTLFDFICGIGAPPPPGRITFSVEQPRIFYFTQVPEVFSRSLCLNVALANIELVDFLRARPEAEETRMRVLLELVREALEAVNLWELARRGERRERLHELSPGEKQRLLFARLFFSNCDLALLDESVASLDAGHYQRIRARLQAFLAPRTCLLISHNEQFLADLCGPRVHPLRQAPFGA